MKIAEIKKLSAEDLQKSLEETQVNLTKVKLAHRISPLENPIQIRDLRRTIARIRTVLTNQQ